MRESRRMANWRGVLPNVLAWMAFTAIVCSGCQCEKSCVLLACVRNTRLVLPQMGADVAGNYEVVLSPMEPPGATTRCSFRLDSSGPTDERCEPAGATLLWESDADASVDQGSLRGAMIPGHFEAVRVELRRDGVSVHNVRASLDHVEEVPHVCDPNDCRVPVLIAE